MSRRPEVTGQKLRVSADHKRRSRGPRRPNQEEIESTQFGEPADHSPPQTPTRGPPRIAYTVPRFCEAAGISLRMYFKLRDAGYGPKETRIGRRVLISLESAMAWMRAREGATLELEAVT